MTFGSEQVGAEDVRNIALGAMENVDTVKMDIDLVTTTDMGGMSMESTIYSQYEIDRANKKMKGTMKMPMLENIEYEFYVVENTFYMNMGSILQSLGALTSDNSGDLLENFPSWIQYEMPSWGSRNQFIMQKELLERAQVKRLSDEKVDGEESYVLKIKPTDAYWDYLDNMIRSGNLMNPTGNMPMSNGSSGENMMKAVENLREAIENISMKGWYSKDSGFPLKCQFRMTMGMENIEPTEGFQTNVKMTIDMTMRLDNYNEPIPIELPDEAENALSLSDLENIIPQTTI